VDDKLQEDIRSILAEGKDLTLATLREDGWPQATTVSYASDGLSVYFGCGGQSQKAHNLAHDDRVSLTVNLPYGPWNEIRGLSLAGRARRLTDPREIERAGGLFMKKFAAELGPLSMLGGAEIAFFEILPEVVSVLDYRKGFGHTDLVQLSGGQASAAA
jgi:hypothetical protein